jgi:hypothetical protein
MKTKNFLILYLLSSIVLLTGTKASSRILRVNNQSNYNGTSTYGNNYGGSSAYPVFKQLNQAIGWTSYNAATDTIHVEASNIIYEAATINKKAIIIGAGFFINENPNVSNGAYDSKIARIDFTTGSSNSQVMGMNVVINGNTSHGYILVNFDVNGVVIKRNRFEKGVAFTGTIAQHIEDVYILQNFFAYSISGAVLYTNNNTAFYPPDDITFNNNICQNKLIWKNSTTTWSIRTCHNNVFDGPANSLNLEFNSDSFRNNILKAFGITAIINNNNNSQVSHNTVSVSTVFSGSVGNLHVNDMTNIFVDAANNTTDGDYQLLPNSDPNHLGADGTTPRGAFGGAETNRYQLSGLAPIPVIYQTLTSGVSTAGSGLPIQIKAKSVK